MGGLAECGFHMVFVFASNIVCRTVIGTRYDLSNVPCRCVAWLPVTVERVNTMACVLVRHFSREIKIFLSMISLRHEVHGVSQIKITFSLDIFLSCVHNRYETI